VTVALTLHWFDHDRRHAEVRRVVRPGGVLACWTDHFQTVSPEVDAVVRRLYTEILGGYWSPERRLVQAGYGTLLYPFEEVAPPPFGMVQVWDLPRLLGYLGTWSSSQRYWTLVGAAPINVIRAHLEATRGDPSQVGQVVLLLHLRVGMITERSPGLGERGP
jgi:hypothetical protein